MDSLDRYFGVHGAALALRSKRLDMIASNIANAATPGYKARDIDFATELKSAETGGIASIGTAQQRAMYRVPVQSSLDGNTVELATEQTAFAENAVQYQTTLSFLNSRIGTLMTALKGE
jgi:flagellar basal-body rod protein FlgB